MVIFNVKDELGDSRRLELSCDAAAKVPYLQTTMSTQIGTKAAQYEIILPKGCSSEAVVSLVKRVDTGDLDLRTHWIATGAKAVILISTADFLMLQDLIPELVKHCRHVMKSSNEAKHLLTSRVTHPDVMALVKELRKGPLAERMTLTQAKSTARTMQDSAATSAVYSTKAQVLLQWLRHNGPQEVEGVIAEFSSTTYFSVSAWGHVSQLKTGAADFAGGLVKIAKEKPSCFAACAKGLFPVIMGSRTVAHPFLDCVVKAFLDGPLLTSMQVETLLTHVINEAWVVNGIGPLLPSVVTACEPDAKDMLCAFLCRSAFLPRIISVELLETISLTDRALLVSSLVATKGVFPDTVAIFIKNAIEKGEL